MKTIFKFKNIGKISNSEIELGNITIICGPNNVGKTYLSYGVYGLLNQLRHGELNVRASAINSLKNTGTVVLKSDLISMDQYVKINSKKFTESLTSFFSVGRDFFKNAKIECVVDKGYEALSNSELKHKTINFIKGVALDLSVEKGTVSLYMQNKDKVDMPKELLKSFVNNSIGEEIYAQYFPKPFVVTSERTGIALFYKELDLSKNRIVDMITKKNNDKESSVRQLNLFDFVFSMTSRYAKPIEDNINTVRDYENLSKKSSFIKDSKMYEEIVSNLQDIIGGKYELKNDVLLYIPNDTKNADEKSVPVYVASSSIKSLFLIDLYINCLAKPNDILIIDEPELNLHPDNQIKMAGLLAKLSNAGVKVLVTTHSDYFIREINNRIMLSNDFKGRKKYMTDYGYVKNDILLPERVQAYSVNEKGIVSKVEKDKFGIKMSAFENLIANSNEASYNLVDLVDEYVESAC